MLFNRPKDVPSEITKVGMSDWYSALSDQNKVRFGRYVAGAETSSKIHFCIDIMRKANADENFPVTELVGEYIIGDAKGICRYDINEEMILALFGVKRYDDCLKCCERGLDLFTECREEIIEANGGRIPEHVLCRNYMINVLIGVDSNYDAADEALDRFFEMGLITEEDVAYRKQSHKIRKLQRVFDGIYAVKLKDQ